jgi:mannose-6-phosphate isomerase-like protein (cupin superfamily)
MGVELTVGPARKPASLPQLNPRLPLGAIKRGDQRMNGSSIFPDPITRLPLADIPLAGVVGYLSQSVGHQILFMEFSEDVELPEHSHGAQWGVVLEGRMDIVIDGKGLSLKKGDRYFIPSGVSHSAKIYAGYADITFFNEPDRYRLKQQANKDIQLMALERRLDDDSKQAPPRCN